MILKGSPPTMLYDYLFDSYLIPIILFVVNKCNNQLLL